MAEARRLNPVTIGVMGTVAAVGYAAWRNKNTRKKMVNAFQSIRDQFTTRFQDSPTRKSSFKMNGKK